jgi:hypothetical protein
MNTTGLKLSEVIAMYEKNKQTKFLISPVSDAFGMHDIN